MTNKPVAWMYVNDDDECEQIEYGECEFEDPDIQLLYTHPVKELTDEEIWEVWKEAKNITLHTEGAIIEVVFAKEILRKASEK